MARLALVVALALIPVGASAEPAPSETAPSKPAPTKPASTKPDSTKPDSTVTLCAALRAASARHGLPDAFFARLIWRESRFDPAARSPAGAEGVAQFMPGTAAGRGLADPFEPARALDESAAYLGELRTRFGNLGLAAAAYNAGPGRLARWIAGATSLPQETIDYVRIVTGIPVEAWRGTPAPTLAPEPNFSCTAFAAAGARPIPVGGTAGRPARPWSVILVGSFNRTAVIAEYAIVRATFAKLLGPLTPSLVHRRVGGQPAKYVMQIEADDRPASERLCKQLERAGGSCVVLRNAGG